MKLGFVSAILSEYTLEELFAFAAEAGFSSVELMCWPPGKANRRYAGVTHLDVSAFGPDDVKRVQDLTAQYGVAVSGLGYYPNPLSADHAESDLAISHLRRLIDAASALSLGVVNSFVGRDPARSVEANWPRFLEVWRPLVQHAEDRGVRIGIENCPMFFTQDEWPGGKNLATTPAIWERMFEEIPSPSFGLNYDPSHLIWQQIDYIAPLSRFRDRLVHIHAKDARINRAALNSHGVLSYPNLWHTPKIPGQGGIEWGAFFGALSDAGYEGHVAIEVEDRAFEGSLEKRKESLIVSRRYLLQFLAG
ncbi:MAG: sugar phosphate isomerase/epimerase [Isosphaeraceae bacterium]